MAHKLSGSYARVLAHFAAAVRPQPRPLADAQAQQYAPPPAPAPAPAQEVDVASQLERLADLKDQGILTEEEFAAQKAKLLGT